MSPYYYLISSLPELVRDDAFSAHPYPVFDDFVREELDEKDYTDMKRCFLLNDISNIADSLEAGGGNSQSDDDLDDMVNLKTPSFLDMADLKQGLEDPDTLFSFFADAIFDWRAEQRQFPHKTVHWELFYRSLVALTTGESKESRQFIGFPLDYLVFEARLRNLTTALAYRKTSRSYEGEIVVFDDFSQMLAESSTPDFGLSREFGVMETLIEVLSKEDVLVAEKQVTAVRWNWLDEVVGYRLFSLDAVFAYALKIADVQRWLILKPEEGRRSLDSLLKRLQMNIKSITQKEYS